MKLPSLVCASDHAGFALKESLKLQFKSAQIDVKDLGPFSADRVDYPDFAALVAQAVLKGEAALGLLICGTGQGMAIAANKVPGIRAAVVGDTFSAKMSRQHNNANVICLGSRVIGEGLAWELVEAFLRAEFEGGRHQDRVEKIKLLEGRFAK